MSDATTKQARGAPFSIGKRTLHMPPARRAAIATRLAQLQAHLASTSEISTVRDDSRLAYRFAAQQTALSLEQVAAEILRTHRLHAQTDYQAVCARVMAHVTQDLYARYGLERATASMLAARYMVPCVKALYESA